MSWVFRRRAGLALLLGLLIPGLSEAAGSQQALEIELAWTEPTSSPREASLRLESSPDSESAEHRDIPVSIPGRIEARLPEGSTWLLRLRAPGLWAQRRLVKIGPRGATAEIAVYPATALEGRVRADGEGPLPEEVEIRFQPAAGVESPRFTQQELRGIQPCPVRRDGTISCALPRGTMDLRFAAPQRVPLYRWAVRLDDEVEDLGTLRLERGASLSGWIQAPARSVELGTTRMLLIPEVIGFGDPETGLGRADLRRYEVKADTRGFFQLSGLRPGRYTLQADHPDFVSTTVAGIEIETGKEVSLDPLELDPGAELELELRQPTDPYGQPWLLELHGRRPGGGRWVEVARMSATLEGIWQTRGLPSGEHLVFVRDSRGGRWVSRTIQLQPGANHHRIEISIERLEGQLSTSGGEPLRGASIRFREREGNSRTGRKSGEEGRFYVFLKRGSLWDIEVRHRELGILSYFSRVEVPEKRSGAPWPRLSFEIPDTEVFGQVVDLLGRPVEEPVVLAFNQPDEDRGFRMGWPMRSGSFEVRGLPVGSVGLVASFDGSVSEKRGDSLPVQVELSEGSPSGPLRLTLTESSKYSGMIVGPTGEGVTGAMVFAKWLRGLDQALPIELKTVHSDENGVFEVDLPTAASRVLLTLLPPGFALTQQEISLHPEEPLVVPVDSATASVRIVYESPDEAWHRHLRRNTFLLGAHVVSSGALLRWTELGIAAMAPNGEVSSSEIWTIPGLQAGRYRACFRNGALQPYLVSGTALPPALVEAACSEEGWVVEGGELRLEIPRRAMERLFAETELR